jgi:glycosyltransferase involved in cell wall biosynthesis
VRILHCIWRMDGGGAERQLVYVAEGLVRRGWDVHVTVAFPGELDERLAATGCRVHQLGARGRFDPMIVLRFVRLVLRLRPDLVQTWLLQMDILGGAVAALLRVPWILSERSSAEQYPPSLRNRMRRFAGRRADDIIANSEGGCGYWKSAGAARIHVIPNATPVTEIAAAPPVTRAESGAAEGEAVIVFVGRFSVEKNLPLLLDALAILIKRRPARAILCGDGPLRGEIESRARALGIEGNVFLPGFVPNVWSWLRAADAQVALSLWEGNPNAVLEGMAGGVPLVVSDIAAHRAILDDASAYFVGADAEEIAGALEAALSHEGSAERVRRARARVGKLSIDDVIQRYEEVYLRLLEHSDGRSPQVTT